MYWMDSGHRTVIVCHWGHRDGTGVFQIGEFDGSGKKLKTFSGPGDLNDFPHACLDFSGRVLVIDSWNGRVMLLNKDLQLTTSSLDNAYTETVLVSQYLQGPALNHF